MPLPKPAPGTDPESFRPALRRYFGRRVADRHEVDDLVQEALVRLVASAQLGGQRDPQAYVFRIAHNLLADRHRRDRSPLRHAAPLDEAELPPLPGDQEDGALLRDLQSMLDAALGELSPRCREVFILKRFREMETAEIAQSLGISQRMVQKYLVQALTHLYVRLAPTMEIYP